MKGLKYQDKEKVIRTIEHEELIFESDGKLKRFGIDFSNKSAYDIAQEIFEDFETTVYYVADLIKSDKYNEKIRVKLLVEEIE